MHLWPRDSLGEIPYLTVLMTSGTDCSTKSYLWDEIKYISPDLLQENFYAVLKIVKNTRVWKYGFQNLCIPSVRPWTYATPVIRGPMTIHPHQAKDNSIYR